MAGCCEHELSGSINFGGVLRRGTLSFSCIMCHFPSTVFRQYGHLSSSQSDTVHSASNTHGNEQAAYMQHIPKYLTRCRALSNEERRKTWNRVHSAYFVCIPHNSTLYNPFLSKISFLTRYWVLLSAWQTTAMATAKMKIQYFEKEYPPWRLRSSEMWCVVVS